MRPAAFSLALLSWGLLLDRGAPEVEAARYLFGLRETVHDIQKIDGTPFTLAYKTSVYMFFAGVYLHDEGYVLKDDGHINSYVPLDAEKIKQLQAQGTLPTPLPGYSISVWNYLFGYSLWVILLGVVGWIVVSNFLGRE